VRRRDWITSVGCFGLAATAPIAASGQNAPPLSVVTSFSILQDLIEQVGKNRIVVRSLIGVDGHAHAFEPRPSHVQSFGQAQMVVLNGLRYEPWADRLIKSANFKGRVLTVSDGIPEPLQATKTGRPDTDPDPHAWQNPRNVIHYVQGIADALCDLDPAAKDHYRRSEQAYLAELRELDQWIELQFRPLSSAQRRVITSHQAFAYFAQRYQIEFLAPQGISSESRPSAKTVARLISQIKSERIKAVFLEHLTDGRLLRQIAKDTGVRVGPSLYVEALTAPGKGAETYLQMMRHNTLALVAGMQAS